MLFLFLMIGVWPSNAQENTVTSPSEGNIYLNFRNINFIKNNEYSNPVIEGYTLLGYFIQPGLVYLPSEKVTLKLGANLLSYSGTDRFSEIKPVFSTTYYFSENTYITLGSLPGSDEHHMSDPHFNSEKLYNSYSEDGFQFRTGNDRIFSDTWLSWENFIFKGDTEREVFTVGESFIYKVPSLPDPVRIELPVQVQFKHFGGQISNYPQRVETYLNVAGGVKLSFDMAEKRNGEAGLEALVFYGKAMTSNASSGIDNGYGGWLRSFYKYKCALVEAGFWKGHDFFAPNGNYIFGSVSDHLSNTIITDRNIVTCSASIRLLPEDFLELFLGFDGYYDTDLKRLDNAITLHLRFNKFFFLTRIKR